MPPPHLWPVVAYPHLLLSGIGKFCPGTFVYVCSHMIFLASYLFTPLLWAQGTFPCISSLIYSGFELPWNSYNTVVLNKTSVLNEPASTATGFSCLDRPVWGIQCYQTHLTPELSSIQCAWLGSVKEQVWNLPYFCITNCPELCTVFNTLPVVSHSLLFW